MLNGVKIIRTAVIPRGNGSGKMLALNYLSFAFTASIRALFMGAFHKYDAILVHETSPITVEIPAIIKKLKRKTKFLFWVLDLWPESLQVSGGINNKTILGLFESIAKSCYRNSDKVPMASERASARREISPLNSNISRTGRKTALSHSMNTSCSDFRMVSW